MLILEIALGIVLAVVILAFWRQILGAGFLLVGAALCLALVGVLAYWGFQHLDVVVVTIGGVVALALAFGLVSLVSKWTGFSVDEIICIALVVAGLLFAGTMGMTYYQRSNEFPVELLYMLPFFGLLVAGAALVVNQIAKRKRLAAKEIGVAGPNP